MDSNILENKIIILDTNVLLHIYLCSPDISEFAIKCLNAAKNDIVIPQTVSIEYKRHQNKEFKKMKDKISSTRDYTDKQLKCIRERLAGVCNELKKLQLPDVELIDDVIDEKWSDIQKEFENYFDGRESVLTMLANAWGDTDKVLEFYKELEKAGNIMPPIDQVELYRLCDTAEKRYEKNTPPGYKDKDKKGKGLRKYGDYLIWWEIIRHAKRKQADVLFVTDDVKEDWCTKSDNGNVCLREELLKDFSQKTKKTIKRIDSKELYNLVAERFGINKSDVVEYALNYTDAMYCEKISDRVFEKVEDLIIYSDTDLISDTTNIGNLGFSDDGLEVLEWNYVFGMQTNREDDLVCYELIYEVKVAGYSSEYWGRDDDTKEVIPSPYSYHEFEGQIKVVISRRVDAFIDFEDDRDFEGVELFEGNLEEVIYKPYNEIDYEGNYNCCPDCGVALTDKNDGGNGFCSECGWKH